MPAQQAPAQVIVHFGPIVAITGCQHLGVRQHRFGDKPGTPLDGRRRVLIGRCDWNRGHVGSISI